MAAYYCASCRMWVNACNHSFEQRRNPYSAYVRTSDENNMRKEIGELNAKVAALQAENARITSELNTIRELRNAAFEFSVHEAYMNGVKSGEWRTSKLEAEIERLKAELKSEKESNPKNWGVIDDEQYYKDLGIEPEDQG